MPRLPAIQVTAMAVTWLLFDMFEYRQAIFLIWAIGFSHYLLGLIYSRKQVTHILSSSANLIPTLVLLAGGTSLYFINGSLTYYFILHHALNETYLAIRFQSLTLPSRLQSKLQAISFSLQLLGALILVTTLPSQSNDTIFLAIFIGFAALLTLYIYEVYRLRKHFNTHSITRVFTELALLVLIPLDHWVYEITLYHLVLYHFAFWIVFPANGQLSRGLHRQFWVYLLLSILSLWFFIGFAPSLNSNELVVLINRLQVYEFWFVVFSFIHITLSFSISNANPLWVIRLFKQRTRFEA